jgi:hypothetical protein
VAFQPIVGFDFNEIGERVLGFPDERKGEWNSQHPAAHFADLHDSFLS